VAVLGEASVVFWVFTGETDNVQAGMRQTHTPLKDERITIYFIPKNLGNLYFDAVSTGFYDAIVELGEENFKYVYTGPQVAEADSQLEFIEKAVQDKANVIFISANSNTALNDAFDKARRAGVRVYVINEDISGSESHRDAAILPVKFDTIGSAQVELLGGQIGYEGQFAVLSATEDAPDQSTFVALMQEELKNNPKYKKMELLEVVFGDDQPEKSASEMRKLLSKYPGLKGVIAPTTIGIAAACRVVREKGVAGKIKVTGLGLPSEMAEFVLDGTCEGFHLWNPSYVGYLGIYMVWAEKKEGFIPVPGAKFMAGKLGEREILPNRQILALQSPMFYDKSNIEQYAVLF
jgi:rhamnose transport system substrate-binding protein